jgi:hypothetical protein
MDNQPAEPAPAAPAPDRHSIEVRLRAHTDDRSAALIIPDVPLNISISELRRIISAKLDRPNTNSEYLLFMGRRVHDAAILRDVARHVVSPTLAPSALQL